MNIVDKTVAFFDPVAALRRTAARATLDVVKNYGYSEGAASRKKKTMKNWRNESASPQSDIDMNLDLSFNAQPTEEQRSLWMVDKIHPSRAGYRDWWLPKFEEALLNLE